MADIELMYRVIITNPDQLEIEEGEQELDVEAVGGARIEVVIPADAAPEVRAQILDKIRDHEIFYVHPEVVDGARNVFVARNNNMADFLGARGQRILNFLLVLTFAIGLSFYLCEDFWHYPIAVAVSVLASFGLCENTLGRLEFMLRYVKVVHGLVVKVLQIVDAINKIKHGDHAGIRSLN